MTDNPFRWISHSTCLLFFPLYALAGLNIRGSGVKHLYLWPKSNILCDAGCKVRFGSVVMFDNVTGHLVSQLQIWG